MEANFADILEEGDTVDKFVQVSGKGRGMAARSRDYVRPIAARYVQSHCQHLLQLQTLRRETEPINITATAAVPAAAPVTTPAAATAVSSRRAQPWLPLGHIDAEART